MRSPIRRALMGGVAMAMLGLGVGARADAYPDRPVRLIISFAPGGATDIIARTLAQKLTEKWKQQVVVDNRPGGNTVISALELMKAKPDGYTLMLALDTTLTMNQHLFRKPKYDPVKDFTPVGRAAGYGLFFMTRPESGAATLNDFVKRAKDENGQLKVGVTSGLNVIGLQILNSALGIQTEQIQYKGTSDATLALLRGDIDFLLDVDVSAAPHVAAGKIKMLATTTPEAVKNYPGVPTFKQLGYEQGVLTAWFGIAGPAGMPAALVSKINQDVSAAISDPQVVKFLEEKSLFVATGGPDEMAKRIEADSAKYGPVIRRYQLFID
jgi:tripartite-type tricarboxylate transporter receptor subunit TctC